MFNFEGRQNLDWLALPYPTIASRVIMLLILSALLALAAPAAHAAGCTAFDFWTKPSEPFYVKVPANNFLSGKHTMYIDDQCDKPAIDHGYKDVFAKFGVHPDGKETFSRGSAFAKNGRKAMEICETQMDQTVAEVRRLSRGFPWFYCKLGERKGPERQRRQILFGFSFKGNAKGALKECRRIAKRWNGYPRPNLVEPDPPHPAKDHWFCYHVWKVNKRYLKRVGA